MADGGGMGGVKFGLTNNKGVMNPVQIEKLEGLDTVVLRGSPQDVEQARRMIQQVEQLGEKGKDLPATGLASLDFQLPARGTLYCLTTPQGEVEIAAREVSNDILRRLAEIAVVAVAALVVWFAVQSARRGRFAWLAERTGSMLLICLGALSFCGGILPVLGLAALVAGCGAMVQRRMCGTRKAAVQQ